MDFDLNELKRRVNNYFEEHESREEIGQWAQRNYYDLLRGEYLEIEKIVGYPFLKLLSTVHVVPDEIRDIFPCTTEEVAMIKDILQGKQDKCFSIDITIPWSINNDKLGLDRNKLSKYMRLYELVTKYLEEKVLNEEQYGECRNILRTKVDKPGTIQFILDTYIRACFNENIDNREYYSDMNSRMGLYSNCKKKEDIIVKMIKYIECYIGKREFGIDIVFISGYPQVIFSIS